MAEVAIDVVAHTDLTADDVARVRPARLREGGWRELAIERKNSEHSLTAILDDVRGDRL